MDLDLDLRKLRHFLADGRRLLTAGRATLERVRRAGLGDGERSLTIGFMLDTNLGSALGRGRAWCSCPSR
ncbi:hypothetical protein [Flindersiella endophytica]